MLILQKCWDENIQTKLFSYTRKPIWQVNSAFQQAVGYENRDKDTHKTRIHTLVSASHSYKDECSKTGNETPKKKPGRFFQVLANQASLAILLWHFSGLKSLGNRLLVLERSENLLNLMSKKKKLPFQNM